MRIARSLLLSSAALVVALSYAQSAAAVSYEQRSGGMRTLYTGAAVVANVVPIVSALVAPQCLPGYVVCKISFAGVSLITATGQLLLSGGSDLPQTRAILYRGFSGDWFLTGRHVAGDLEPHPLPEPPPPSNLGGGWEPPPR